MNTKIISRLQDELAGRFVIDRELGRGGMGVVFQARDIALGRQVAIKLLNSEVSGLGGSAFRREIKFTARLQHPHILPLLETGEIEGHAYYIMPFVKGGSLRDRMRVDGGMPLKQVLKVAQEIGAALETAHQSNIVHCDIKPENILISNGYAVLADFGIARAILKDGIGWRKTDYESLGSPVYISPEQASGEKEIDQRADVYSLACVIYEMLAGKPPFEGESVESIVARRFTEMPAPVGALRHDVPASLSHTISRAMELDPRDRFASMGQFIRAMETAVAVGTGEHRAIRTSTLIGSLSSILGLGKRNRASAPQAVYASTP